MVPSNNHKLITTAIILVFFIITVQAAAIPINTTPYSPFQLPTRSLLYVGGNGPNNYTSIAIAVQNASSGDTIFVYAGTYHEHITLSKPLTLRGENPQTTIIDGSNTGNIVKITANNCSVSQFTMQNGGIGIYLVGSNNHRISQNILKSNWNGIGLWNTTSSLIEYNTVENNFFEGISLTKSHTNTLNRNTISGNLQGIYLSQSTNNLIHQNQISSNSRGIEIRTNADNNNIYHNNIKNSAEDNGFDECANTWDNGYPSGGNYWNDYNGFDNDGDGIGDTPYSIEGGTNKDHYPFMDPLTWNTPPQQPYNPYPPHQATNISLNPYLRVTVFDYDNDLLTVSFYNASDNSLIDQLTNIPSGSDPGVQWEDLAKETTYHWYVIVDDGHETNQSSTWEFTTGSHTNQPPSYPNIAGKSRGKANTEYSYTFTAYDPENQEIYFLIDWGDQTNTGWIGPYASGTAIQQSHSWSYGSFSIKAKTKDSEGAESDWSPFFPVSMPVLKNYEIFSSFSLIIEKVLLILNQFFSQITLTI